MTTTRTMRRRWWLLPGVLALLAVTFGLADANSPAGQAVTHAESLLDTGTTW